LREFLIKNNLKIDPPDTIVLFFASFFYSFPFNKELFFKHFCNNIVICIHMSFFKSYSICLVIKNQSFPCLSFLIYSYCKFLITKDTMHDLCTFKVNFCIIIDTKKLQHKDNLPCGFQLFFLCM
jgi:hypothetical protein